MHPTIEDKYEILDKLKEGGMGTIYRVRHRLLGEIRVVKVMRPQLAIDGGLRRRFEREARMGIRLRHPNVAQLYDFSVDRDGGAFMVMEFIDGVTLQEVLRTCGPPSLGLTVELADQGLDALRCLHRHGLVHRDVSPDNLMLCRSFDGAPLVKLIDLGIAKETHATTQVTASGVFVGKVRYAAPEQFSHSSAPKLAARSDLYAFGVLLYELLTGSAPFAGDSFSEIAASHLFHPPRDFCESDPEGRIPEGLRRIVLWALEKDPRERLPDAERFLSELAPFRPSEPPDRAAQARELAEILTRTEREPDQLAPGGDAGATETLWQPGREADESPAATETVTTPVRSSPRGRQPWLAAAALAVAIAAGAAWFLPGWPGNRIPDRPAPAKVVSVPATPDSRQADVPSIGALALDALPWAEVRSIVDETGRELASGGELVTPLHLELPAGSYTITLASPAAPEPERIEVEIVASETTARTVELGTIDEAEYFARIAR